MQLLAVEAFTVVSLKTISRSRTRVLDGGVAWPDQRLVRLLPGRGGVNGLRNPRGKRYRTRRASSFS
jgi:hypothetical protein